MQTENMTQTLNFVYCIDPISEDITNCKLSSSCRVFNVLTYILLSNKLKGSIDFFQTAAFTIVIKFCVS